MLLPTTLPKATPFCVISLFNSILSCFTNVFFNWVFIFGHLGFPAMGVVGAAVGTLVARIIEFLVCFLTCDLMKK